MTSHAVEIEKEQLSRLDIESHSELMDLGMIDLALYFSKSQGLTLTSSVGKWGLECSRCRPVFEKAKTRRSLAYRLFSSEHSPLSQEAPTRKIFAF